MQNTVVFYLLLGLTVLTHSVWGQSLSVTDVTPIADHSSQANVKIDHAGNVLMTGKVYYYDDLIPGTDTLFYPPVANSDDFYFQKLDSNGQHLWTRKFGSAGYDRAWLIAEDEDHNLYLTFTFKGTLDVDPGPGEHWITSHSHDGTQFIDIGILKFDPDGNFIWARNYDSWTPFQAYSGINRILPDGNGHLYIAGAFGNELPVEYSETFGYSNGNQEAFVMKLDTDGNTIWTKTFGGNGKDAVQDLLFTAEKDLLLSGDFRLNVDFDPSNAFYNVFAPAGTVGLFILKLDTNGNFIWVKTSEGGLPLAAYIALDNDENIYWTSVFHGTTDFDPGPEVHNLSIPLSIWGSAIVKLDKTGAYQWGKSYKSLGTSIHFDKNNYPLINGGFSGTVDFDPSFLNTANVTSVGESDIYFTKLDANGYFKWVVTWGTESIQSATIIRMDNDGTILAGFRQDQSLDADPGPEETLLPGESTYLVTFNDLTVGVLAFPVPEAAHVFPNPTTGTTTIEIPGGSGTLFAELKDPAGKVVRSQTLTGDGPQQIHFDGPAGVYYLLLSDGKGRQMVATVVKQ